VIKKKKIILFPIESIVRELDYKLMLASMYANKGNIIFIGQHDYIYEMSKYITKGMYLGKNLFSIREDGTWQDRHSILKSKGFSIIHLDEEGAVYWGDEKTWRRRLNKRMDVGKIKFDDYICTWGIFQKRHYEHVTAANSNNIFNTGHPRFDMLLNKKYAALYKKEVHEITLKYGDFVLIPTAFAWFNNPQGYKDSFSKRWNFSYDGSIEAYKEQIENWSYSGKMFCEYINMALSLSAKFPNINFIIRPHPAEDIIPYISAFSKINNIHIEKDNNIAPWLLACKVLIQDGCTTAIEGFFAGKKVINFQLENNRSHQMFLPSVVSDQKTSIDSVIKSIQKILIDENLDKVVINDKAKSLLKNFSINNNSFLNIINVMDKASKSIESSTINRFNFGLFRARYKTFLLLKKIIRPLFKDKYRQYKIYKSTFPGLNKKNIEEKVNKINEITGNGIEFNYINENLIAISKEK